MAKRYPKAPSFKVTVTERWIEEGVRKDSGICMISEAIKEAYPGAKWVSSDIQTLRATDPVQPFRYTYLTPRIAQVALVQFDQGIRPEPFSFTLARGQVSRSGSKPSGVVSAAKRAAASVAGEKGRLSQQAHVSESFDGALPETAVMVDRGNKNSVPDKVGGKPPPLAPLARRRAFGLRALKL